MDSKRLTLAYPVCYSPCHLCPYIPRSPSSLLYSHHAGNMLSPSQAHSLLRGHPASFLDLPHVLATLVSSYSASSLNVCHLCRDICHSFSSTPSPSHSWLPSSKRFRFCCQYLSLSGKALFVYMCIHCIFNWNGRSLRAGPSSVLVTAVSVTPRSVFNKYLSR